MYMDLYLRFDSGATFWERGIAVFVFPTARSLSHTSFQTLAKNAALPENPNLRVRIRN